MGYKEIMDFYRKVAVLDNKRLDLKRETEQLLKLGVSSKVLDAGRDYELANVVALCEEQLKKAAMGFIGSGDNLSFKAVREILDLLERKGLEDKV